MFLYLFFSSSLVLGGKKDKKMRSVLMFKSIRNEGRKCLVTTSFVFFICSYKCKYYTELTWTFFFISLLRALLEVWDLRYTASSLAM